MTLILVILATVLFSWDSVTGWLTFVLTAFALDLMACLVREAAVMRRQHDEAIARVGQQ